MAGFWTDDRDETLRRLWCEERMTYGQLAEYFGVSRSAIAGRINRKHIPRKGQAAVHGQAVVRAERERKARTKKEPVEAKPPRAEPQPPLEKLFERDPLPATSEIKPPLVSPVVPSTGLVRFMDLDKNDRKTCRFIPVVDIRDRFRSNLGIYCGHDVVPGKEMCEEHDRRCHDYARMAKKGYVKK